MASTISLHRGEWFDDDGQAPILIIVVSEPIHLVSNQDPLIDVLAKQLEVIRRQNLPRPPVAIKPAPDGGPLTAPRDLKGLGVISREDINAARPKVCLGPWHLRIYWRDDPKTLAGKVLVVPSQARWVSGVLTVLAVALAVYPTFLLLKMPFSWTQTFLATSWPLVGSIFTLLLASRFKTPFPKYGLLHQPARAALFAGAMVLLGLIVGLSAVHVVNNETKASIKIPFKWGLEQAKLGPGEEGIYFGPLLDRAALDKRVLQCRPDSKDAACAPAADKSRALLYVSEVHLKCKPVFVNSVQVDVDWKDDCAPDLGRPVTVDAAKLCPLKPPESCAGSFSLSEGAVSLVDKEEKLKLASTIGVRVAPIDVPLDVQIPGRGGELRASIPPRTGIDADTLYLRTLTERPAAKAKGTLKIDVRAPLGASSDPPIGRLFCASPPEGTDLVVNATSTTGFIDSLRITNDKLGVLSTWIGGGPHTLTPALWCLPGPVKPSTDGAADEASQVDVELHMDEHWSPDVGVDFALPDHTEVLRIYTGGSLWGELYFEGKLRRALAVHVTDLDVTVAAASVAKQRWHWAGDRSKFRGWFLAPPLGDPQPATTGGPADAAIPPSPVNYPSLEIATGMGPSTCPMSSEHEVSCAKPGCVLENWKRVRVCTNGRRTAEFNALYAEDIRKAQCDPATTVLCN